MTGVQTCALPIWPGAGPAAAAAAVPGAAPAAAAAAASRGRRGRQQQAREEPGTAHHQVRVATSGGQGRRPGSQSGECGRRGGGGLPSPRSREKTTPLSRGLGGAAWTRLPGTGKPASRGHVAGAQALDAGMGEGRGTRMARTDRVNQWGPALCRALDKEPRSSGAPAWLQALGVGTRGRPSVLVAPWLACCFGAMSDSALDFGLHALVFSAPGSGFPAPGSRV